MSFKYLNIGGGNFHVPEDGWANLDFPFERYSKKRNFDNIDFKVDLMSNEPFPIENESFEIVYSSHTIEHLPAENVAHMFSEAFRILKVGGLFRISCPDADKFYESLAGISKVPISSYWIVKGESDEKVLFFDALFYHLYDKISPKEFRRILTLTKNEFFADIDIAMSWYPITKETQNADPSRHVSWWNHEKAKTFMEKAGFTNISKKLKRNKSAHEALRKHYIDDTAPECSLYVEATKG